MVTVPWRRVALLVAAVTTALAGLFVVLRTDGYPAIDATVARATRWFVDETAGVAVLADGFSGQTLVRLQVPGEPAGLSIAQSASGVAVLDSASATARMIDTVGLRIGPPQSVRSRSSRARAIRGRPRASSVISPIDTPSSARHSR